MSSYLQSQIQTRMEAKKLTIYALERKAGLKRSAARNILQGFSKKPSAETLKAIANVLDCTVDDLVGSVSENPAASSMIKVSMSANGTHQWDEKLCLDTIKLVSKNLNDRNLDLKYEQVLALAGEVYKYSLAKQSDTVDQAFVSWLINKNF